MNQDLRGLENDEAGVRALMQRLYEAWGEEDADAFAALFTEDADYGPSMARCQRGGRPLRIFTGHSSRAL